MANLASSSPHDRYAADYDRQVREFHCNVQDIVFGLCYEFVLPGEHLLDIGIGTGLSGQLFARAGLQVYGSDSSPEMLKICQSKGFAVELRQMDIENVPWQYGDASFEHVASCGVFHFCERLDAIFTETARVIRPSGVFAFTIKTPRLTPEPALAPEYVQKEVVDSMAIFMHSSAVVRRLMTSSGFELVKQLRFFVGEGSKESDDQFIAYVTRKTPHA